ncbi:MAG: HetP family heterocyst commitment protein [Symploca sp. SIO2B6]|nr:HetP family heterocyst commitment protein [Symploca sp. SIO2B6]
MVYTNNQFDKGLSSEQFNQIVEAILDGKYSWACVLLLRFAGYNPLHYIPYRTYSRLNKENCQNGQSRRKTSDTIKTSKQKTINRSNSKVSSISSSKIRDLKYCEVLRDETKTVQGGHREHYLNKELEEYQSISCQSVTSINQQISASIW